MKKLLTLLTLVLLGMGSAWADTVIYSWEGAQGGATETGGTIKSYATDGGDETTDDINQNNGSNDFWYIRLRGASDFSTNVVKITLNSALAAGDQIKVTGYRNKNASGKKSGFKAKFDKGSSTVGSSTGLEFVNIDPASGDEYSDTPNTCTFDVPNDATGSTVITMTRSQTSTNMFVSKIEIVRAEATAPTITKQPVSASYKQNATAIALTVAATASAGTLSYQWYSNTSASTEGASVISGATSDSYTPSTASLGKTYYYCAVTDGNGTTNSEFAAITVANTSIVGYTEAVNGAKLDARVLSGADNITISAPIFGSNITDFKGTSKSVIMDGTTYASTDSWRKSKNGTYDGQNVGYTLTVASGYKMNISHVSAKIAVADDTYTWYVEILNAGGEQVWKSGEKTSKRTGTSGVVDADVDVNALTGTVTVNLFVMQGGSTKYFSINYLQLTVASEVDSRPTYTMSVSANDDTMGSVSPADGTEIAEGENVTFTATPNTGYKFVKWTIDGADYTTNPYTIENVTAIHNAVATFEALYKVTYVLGDYAGTVGKVLNNENFGEVYADANGKYTIPSYAHRYLYREGYILSGWTDGTNTYATGDELTLTEDITLTPTWTATTQTLAANTSEVTVTWNMRYSQILFNAWQGTGAVGYYTKPQTINGELIAVPMIVDATSGKVDNSGRASQDNAQVNQGTKFTIPAVSGMIIKIADANTAFSTTTIAGSTEYEGTGTKTISYTYTGTDETIDIVIGENNQYLKTIAVTYPAKYIAKTITSAGYATLYCDQPLNFEGTGLTAYIATVSGSTVNFSTVTSIPANTGVLLKGTAGDYEIPVAASTTDVSANKFVGVTTATEVAAGIFVLLNGDSGVGFYKTQNAFTVGANTAYLPADVAGARTFIGFDSEETTGISDATRLNDNVEMINNNFFDLQGRRVAQPTKGLYIVNGKKVVK